MFSVLAVGGCGTPETAPTTAIPSAAAPSPSTSSSASDAALLAELCQKHCVALTLKGISPCDSEARCDANVAKARARVLSLVTDAQAAGWDIEAAPGFAGPFASEDRAHQAYESRHPCRGATNEPSISSECFSGVADYLLTVQLIGSALERMS
ncbi:MAG: hypothetical protein ABWY56_02085 [Propionibacteriaceae bacterium]